MKNFLTFALILGFQLAVLAQTKKPTTPAKKPASTATRPVTTTTKPATTAVPPANATPAKPAATTELTAEELQKRQELYDKYNGTTPKAAKPAPSSKPKTSPTRPTDQPKPRQEMSRATEYERSNSSNSDESKFRVGFRAGVNLANFGEAGTFTFDATESLPAFHAGVIFNIGGKTFSVQPEILFSQLGVKAQGTFGGQSISSQSVINTVQVPVLLKLAFGGDKFRFFINGGGYGSYWLGGTSKVTLNGATTTGKVTFTDNDGRFEYGAVAGAGIQLGLGRAKLLIEGRYNYGLGNDAKKVAGAPEIYSRVVMGSVGLLIPL